MFTPCLHTYTLCEFFMIAGDSEVLEFSVFDTNGSPVDLTGSTITWVLAPYGQLDYNACEAPGEILDVISPGDIPNKFIVNLATHLTIDLEHGKYIQQPIITDVQGEQKRVAQGILTILNEIPMR